MSCWGLDSMRRLIVDMDDISLDNPDANGLNYAFYLKGKFPKFKINLFTIPGRSTKAWIRELASIPWIELGVHGNMHDESEVINNDIIDRWSIHFSHYYKGPNWKVTAKEANLLIGSEYTIITKEWLNRDDVYHGHCWIKSDWEKLESLINQDTEFDFISKHI